MRVSRQEVKRFAAAKGAQVKVFVRELIKRHFNNDFFRMAVLVGKDKDCAYRLFIAAQTAYIKHQCECHQQQTEPDAMPEFDDVQAELEELWQDQSVEKLLAESAVKEDKMGVMQKRLVRKQEVIEQLCEVIDRSGSSLPEGIEPEDLPQKKEPRPLAEGEEDDEQEDPTHWSLEKLKKEYGKLKCKLSEEELHERMVDPIHDALLAAFWPDKKERQERKLEMLSAPSYDAFKLLIGNYVSGKKLTRQQAVSLPFANAAHFYISFKKGVTASSLNTVLYRFFRRLDGAK